MDEEDRYTRITLRIPKDMHARLDEAADATSKSLNAEIIGRLQVSFDGLGADSELRQELAHTREVLDTYRKMMKVSEGTEEMLARYLVALHGHLPAKLQSDQNMSIPLRLARALLEKDGARMADVFADLFADDHTVVAEMKQLRAELENLPLQKRGDTVPPLDIDRGKFVEIPEFDTKLVRGRATKPPSPRSGPVNKLIPIPGGLERYQAVLDRRVPAEPLAPKPSANKGPTRSANARKSLPKR